MLDINPLLLLFEVGLFLVLLIILNATLFKPLLDHIDQRNASMGSETDAAAADLAESERLLQEADAVIAAAKKEAGAIRDAMIKEAKAAAAAKVEAAKTMLAQRTAEFEAALEESAEALRATLRAQEGQMGALITAKLQKVGG